MSILKAFQSEKRDTIDVHLETPATEGKRNHETLYGSLARSAWHWRIACFLVLAIVIWDRIELAVVVNEKQYVPVVIAEHEDGSTRFVGTPDPTWKPTDRNVIASLKELVETIRGRTLDAGADRRHWQRMVDRSTEKGRTMLAEAYTDLEKVEEKGPIDVDIIAITKESDHVFQVRWQERRRDVNRALVSTSRWWGRFTIQMDVPGTLVELAKNETGVWHDGWSISQEREAK